ncbi:hypothetical protein GIB67_037787 [Kingdonia uniflora]|uniref:Uncharacterized protein n=1 Tax=Kingdonia uniflora TaxID=39325 RepID=A0A7J7LV79_9MAGN|nr:hypothetical protein GIB67_037787 [Kingdonia uniflora]
MRSLLKGILEVISRVTLGTIGVPCLLRLKLEMKKNMALRQIFQVSLEIFYNDVEARKDTLCYPIVEIHAFDSLLQKLHKFVPYDSFVTDLNVGASSIRLSLAIARKCRQVIG